MHNSYYEEAVAHDKTKADLTEAITQLRKVIDGFISTVEGEWCPSSDWVKEDPYIGPALIFLAKYDSQ